MGIRVLIVDDEDAQREGLAAHLPWADLGFDPPLLASNGPEALELAARNAFDVILADVNMGGMSGIDVVRLLKAENRGLCALMISGYGEFEYVQESMEAGADGYVLKPVQTDEVTGWLVKFRRMHELRLEVAQRDRELLRRSSETQALARQRFLSLLVNETWRSQAELAAAARSVDLPENPGPCRLITLAAPGAEADPSVASRGLSAVETVLARRGPVVGLSSRPGEALVVELAGPGGLEPENDLREALTTGLGGLDLGAAFHVVYSPVLELWEQVNPAYWENRAILGEVRPSEGPLVLFSRSGEPGAVSDPAVVHQLQERVLAALRSGAYADLARDLAALRHAATFGQRYSFPLVQALYLQVAAAALAAQEETRREAGPPLVEVFRTLLSATDGPELADRTTRFVLQTAEDLQAQALKKRHHSVDRCLALIEAHYAEDLTLKDLAGAVDLNPSYLSVLFKSVVGTTVTEHLTRVRMDRAKALLRRHEHKVYEISALVGFKTIGYFSTVFHREVGVTPGEYREGKGT